MAEPPEKKQPKKEDYGVTGKTREKQVPGKDGMQHPESHGTDKPATPDPKTPDDDDPRRTEREREPEKA